VLKDEEAEQAIRTIVLPRGSPGSQEGPLAPACTRDHGRQAQAVLSIFRGRQTTSKAIASEVHDLLVGCGAVWLRQGQPGPQSGPVPSGPLANIGWLVA